MIYHQILCELTVDNVNNFDDYRIEREKCVGNLWIMDGQNIAILLK